MHVIVRMARAGNGVPVFTASGRSMELKRPFGATFDDDRSIWMYPAYFPVARKVLADFQVLGQEMRVEYSDTTQEYINELEKIEENYSALKLPEGFTYVTKPFDHQILGLCHSYYMLRSALFYAPGLGKSKCAIDLARLERFTGYKDLFVVMGPLVSIRNWGKEINRHSGKQLTWGAVLGDPEQKRRVIERAAAREFDFLLVTYDTARRYTELIYKLVPYSTVIADESHLIKEWRSQRTIAAHEIGQKARRKVIMTGTPTLGNPMDLYGQYKFLADHLMPEAYHRFRHLYLTVSPANKHVVLGYKNLDILNERTTYISLRKTKEECIDLPPQTIVDLDVPLSRHQSVIYNQLIDEMGINLETLLAQLAHYKAPVDQIPPPADLPHVAAMLNKLMQVASGFLIKNNMDPKLCDTVEEGGCRFLRQCVAEGIKPYTSRCQVQPKKIPNTITTFNENPKLDTLVGLFDSVLEDPANKIIVWCYYRAELDIVEKKLQDLKLGYVRADGDTGERINDLEEQFNTDPVTRVYLAQISTGVSITLNAAAYMVFYSLTYNLKDYLQAIDRNYRIGQQKNVTVYRLLGKHTVEPGIVKLLDAKVDLDQVLTHRMSCLVCPHNLKCFDEGIKLFDVGCIFRKDMVRPVMKPRRIVITEEMS